MNLDRQAFSSRPWSRGRGIRLSGIAFLFILLGTAFAQAITFCEVCKLRKGGTFYSIKSDYYDRKLIVCKFCAELKESCGVCELPVLPNTGLRLPDKRAFCPDHVKTVVMEDERAASIFAKAKDEMMDLVRQYPPLPHLNIKFHLVTREDFVREYRRTPGLEDPYALLGLTVPRRDKEGKYEFDVFVVHGLTEETFLSVCAHEYTHTWLIERTKPERQLHPDTIEGVCEFMAHKVVSKFGYEREKKRIVESTYSRGQVNALIAAEKEHSFYKMVRWITDGVDSWMDKDKLQRLLVLRDDVKEEEPPPALNWVQTKAPPAYEKLLLKGLSGTGNRRFALINDATLASGEEGKVRLGTSNVVVRCLRIENNTVTVQVRGEATSRTLQLGQK